jgi:predicted outer membrane protein
MLRRIPRFLRISVIVAVLVAVSVSVYQSWSSGTPGTGGWVQTQWGPLGPADRDLLVKVRLAGLWEAPTSQQAMQQASSPEVKEIGRILSTEHATLDVEVRKVADQLGVLLPTSPNSQQLGWMKEISAATGSDYDRIYVQRVREAHGIVLPIIAQVRVSTRNDLIRQFAATADQYVTGHIQHLEHSGMVNYSQLPDAPSPGLLSGDRSASDLVLPLAVFAAALLAAVWLFSALRRRSARRPVRPTVTRPSSTALAIPSPRNVISDDTEVFGQTIVAATLGETSGSHRLPRTAPGETTGPRHAVRR